MTPHVCQPPPKGGLIRRQGNPGTLSECRDNRELGDRAEYLKEHPAHGRGGVNPLVEHHQAHAALLELPGEANEMLSDRPSRSSLVTTSWSPARVTSSALSSSARRASLPDALSMNTSAQSAAARASC